MSGPIEVTLDCGCQITVRTVWDSPVCDCCGPGEYYPSGGQITTPCAAHNPDVIEYCPYDCSRCHDPYDCDCPNCAQIRDKIRAQDS